MICLYLVLVVGCILMVFVIQRLLLGFIVGWVCRRYLALHAFF